MVSRQTNDVISALGTSRSCLYSGCSGSLRYRYPLASQVCSGRLAMVLTIARTQAVTAEIWIAEDGMTALPETLEPKVERWREADSVTRLVTDTE